MKKNEIFNNFIKIAEEKGLISHAKTSKQILEETGRADSRTMEEVTKLYDLKLDAPKDMQYDNNISELAHPGSLVIAPSYDKLNGLVETNQERQNIIRHILNKTPSGQIFQQKYAQQLILSLVKAANDLDNRNESELRSLADACLLQVSGKSIVKEGIGPLAIILPIAATLGAIYAKNHLPFISDGFKADNEKLMKELDDLLNSNTDFGVGNQYSPEFLSMVSDLKARLEQFASLEESIEPILSELEAPKTADELKGMATKQETQAVVSAYNNLHTAAINLSPYLEKVMQEFGSDFYKKRQVVDKGIFSDLIDKVPGLHGGYGLVADDFDDVKHALQTYMKDVQDILKVLDGAKTVENNAKNSLQESMVSNTDAEAPATATKPATNDAGEKAPWDDLESELPSELTGLSD
jgi:hypothetical protein